MARFQVSVLWGVFAFITFLATGSIALGDSTTKKPTVAAGPAASSGTPSAAAPAANPLSAISGSTAPAVRKESWFFEKLGRLGSIDIRAKVKILDTELIEGLRVAANYKYELEPAYDGEYHWRMDRGVFDLNVNIGELINRTNRYVGLSLNHGMGFLYVRPYTTRTEAFSAVPFGFKGVPTSVADVLERLPFTAANIVENFDTGDIFSFNAFMNIVVGASTLPLNLSHPASLYSHYLISGEFQVNMVKIDPNTIELKLIAVRQRGPEAGFSVGIGSDHRILGLRVVDRRIAKITNVSEMFKVAWGKSKFNLNMAHYVLDLRNPDVREAYDGMTAKLLEINTLKIIDPTNSAGELTDLLISDVTPFETLYERERRKPEDVRVVDRLFMGKNDVHDSDHSNFKVAPIIVKFTRDTEYYENVLTETKPDGSINYSRLHTFQRTQGISWWLSYYKATSVSSASMALASDITHKVGKVQDIAFEWNYRDKALTRSELRMIKDAVHQLVPEVIRKKLNWGVFSQDRDFSNARFIYKMILKPEVLSKFQYLDKKGNVIGGWPQGNIHELLNRYVLSIPAPSSDLEDPFGELNRSLSKFYTVADKFKASIEHMAKYLSQVVDPGLSEREHATAFAELRFNNLFTEIGPGFIVSLLDEAELMKWATFEVSMTADDVPPMKPVKLGARPNREAYEAAKYVHSVLAKNEFEMLTQMSKAVKARREKLAAKSAVK